MKRPYIAPETDIETLHLKGSVLEDNTDPGYGRYSDTSDDVHSNVVEFDESELQTEIIASPNLWDE